ncbi:IucA/IucC family protein [Streptomyces sp. NPDC006879]|uniref:IucA/IucC family protein n=1 Tax=Streptomyces sp. NPDC006879 TaxID=3364767 RepID=UPI003690D762
MNTPSAHHEPGVARTADAYAIAPLLNCLLREAAEPTGSAGVHRLRGSGRLLRVSGGRRPAEPRLGTEDGWQRLNHSELIKLTAEELRLFTGVSNDEVLGEMIDSRDAIAAVLTARSGAQPPGDPYLCSEQSLVMGHPAHPAPKARSGLPAGGWLPYAPEVHARFPLVFLGVRADLVAEEGGPGSVRTLDRLDQVLQGPTPPAGYRLLPAHPWQLDLVGRCTDIRRAFADGRLLRLGPTRRPVWPTASVRTLYLPDTESDLFLKFSLDVRITNDVRRLWRHDLVRLRHTDAAVETAFVAVRTAGSSAAWLCDSGYRTASFAFEELAVLVREGLHQHLLPRAQPLLAASLAQGFDDGPARRTTDPIRWWSAYLRQVVPPVLEVFARHGLVLEAHLQNTVIAVDSTGTPVQALFRDAEGVKQVAETGREAAWERLVYCLVVNHLSEIAATLAEHHPEVAPALWPAARDEFLRYDAERGLAEISAMLRAPTIPGKTNLLLRWTGADGAESRYRPLPNPLCVEPAATGARSGAPIPQLGTSHLAGQ